MAAGEFAPDHLDGFSRVDGDSLIGVDFGITSCLQAGEVPDVIVGDFDSIDVSLLNDPKLANADRYQYPIRKNFSDLELALIRASELGATRVVVTGVSGGRSDHHLFNWLLPIQRRWSFAIELIDATTHAYVVSPEFTCQRASWYGQTISLVPLSRAQGVTTKGLEYALDDAVLDAGSTLGLSNIALGNLVDVKVKQGKLLAFFNKS